MISLNNYFSGKTKTHENLGKFMKYEEKTHSSIEKTRVPNANLRESNYTWKQHSNKNKANKRSKYLPQQKRPNYRVGKKWIKIIRLTEMRHKSLITFPNSI